MCEVIYRVPYPLAFLKVAAELWLQPAVIASSTWFFLSSRGGVWAETNSEDVTHVRWV